MVSTEPQFQNVFVGFLGSDEHGCIRGIALKCFFVSDLHGMVQKYDMLFDKVIEESPNAVFLGGDILPSGFGTVMDIEEFLEDVLFAGVRRVKESCGDIRFFVIMGNDDPRYYEHHLVKADSAGLVDYVHGRVVEFEDLFVVGYSFVPPTPFQLKDWERYDVSRFIDVGAVSPEEGSRTVDVPKNEIRFGTISEDLQELGKLSPPERTIYLFHSPPYDSCLDMMDLGGRMINHAPVDVHVGSIAIQRFILERRPFLTLHGHIHESPRLSGSWREQRENTFSFSGAHDGAELAIVRFDTDDLSVASRDLVVRD